MFISFPLSLRAGHPVRLLLPLMITGLLMAGNVDAKTLERCRYNKSESLRLEKAIRKGKLRKPYKSKAAMRHALREHGRYLRKQCGGYRREMREITKRAM